MSQDNRIQFECTEPNCKRVTHDSKKNKKKLKARMEMKMYCKFCKKHTLHKETK